MAKQDPKLLDEMFTPYSDAELEFHRADRDWKNIFEMLHAQNHYQIDVAVRLRAYLDGTGPESEGACFSSSLYPESNPHANFSVVILERLHALMLETPCEQLPCPKIVCFVSRSSLTLLALLEKIRPTGHLLRARCALKEIFGYLAGLRPAPPDNEAYRARIDNLFGEFIENCRENAAELYALEGEVRQARILRPQFSPYAKKPRRQRFDKRQRALVHEVWQQAQNDPRVLRLSGKTRASHAAAFVVYKKMLARVDILTEEDFVRCLASWRNHENYVRKNG